MADYFFVSNEKFHFREYCDFYADWNLNKANKTESISILRIVG